MKLIPMLIIFLAHLAHAKPMVVGPYMDKAQLPESTCLVTVKQKNSDYVYSCSSTLISPSKILTAIHCFTDTGEHSGEILPYSLDNAKVKCTDSTGKIHESKLDTEEFMFSETRSQDITLAELDTPITGIVPMKVATKAEFNTIIGNSVANDCAAIGYGRDNADKSGNKNGVTLKNQITQQTELTLEFSQETSYSVHKSIIRQGDSGGSLACRLNNEWVLIGMNKSSTYDSGLASIVTQEHLYDLRVFNLKQSQERIANYTKEKQAQKPITKVTKEDSRISELYKSGYSIQDLLSAGYSIKRIADKVLLKFDDFIQAGISRIEVLKELIPVFPKYIDQFPAGQVANLSYVIINNNEIRKGITACSVAQTGDNILIYDSEKLEVRDNKTNTNDDNRRWFEKRASAEEYLIEYDPRCLGKKIKSFITTHQISAEELAEIGMSEFVIKKINSQGVRETKRNPNPKTKSVRMRNSRANLRR
ncbi:MAG: trypsin-like serine protease [Xanthomonadaceae bacterium]|nr:trypsin-like serine protease [Xanthomonadaceae bacterium]